MSDLHEERDVRRDLARLPQVDALLRQPEAAEAAERFGRAALTDAVRDAIHAARQATLDDGAPVPDAATLLATATARLTATRDRSLRRVINATGVVLHTNLGRAPLSAAARQAVNEAAGYTDLEYDLAKGTRGSRTRHVGELAAEACGTQAATVVNNGAAGLVLTLAALSHGRETVVSRGELIEIGGSYRLPDVMAASGAVMREVGTTNRTRAADYAHAIGPETGLLLKVHPSNFAVVGFTEAADAEDLADLGRDHDVPFVYDLGSGLLRSPQAGSPLAGEPSVDEAVASGADLVIFSGDKLLGGPQAGIIAGRRDLVERCRTHPLARAFRIDKMQRAALEATLEAHLREDNPAEVPTLAMLHADPDELGRRAHALADELGDVATVEPTEGLVGGGSLPTATLPSHAVVLGPDGLDVEGLATALRRSDPPVIARIEDGRLMLDLRTVPPSEDALLADLLLAALDQTPPSGPGGRA